MKTTRRFTESSEFGDRHERLEAIKIDLNSFLLLLDLPTEKYGNGRRVNYGRPRYVRPSTCISKRIAPSRGIGALGQYCLQFSPLDRTRLVAGDDDMFGSSGNVP